MADMAFSEILTELAHTHTHAHTPN